MTAWKLTTRASNLLAPIIFFDASKYMPRETRRKAIVACHRRKKERGSRHAYRSMDSILSHAENHRLYKHHHCHHSCAVPSDAVRESTWWAALETVPEDKWGVAKCGFASLDQAYRLSGANPPAAIKVCSQEQSSRDGLTADDFSRQAPCCTRTENARMPVLADKVVVDGLF